jgi:hypothetical protein
MRIVQSSCTLEVSGASCDSHRLVHDPLADAEVVVDPFAHFFVLAGEAVGFEPVPSQYDWQLEPSFWSYVKPVERFMPARNAETASWLEAM